MIRIEQVKMSISARPEELPGQICHILGIRPQELQDWEILRRSLDARKKPDLWYVYTLEAKVSDEAGVLKRAQKNNRNRDRIRLSERREYRLPAPGEQGMEAPPVIVGSGPAGLFCALVLAQNGYRPVLLERGGSVEERTEAVRGFWESGRLDPECNVQFGEGGAGTFSDGKLNTLVKDPEGRARKVLEIFTRFGAEESIVYDAKPHLGTDVLTGIVRGMREEIRALGGEVLFHSRVTDLMIRDGRVQGVVLEDGSRREACAVVLACGHSARDTFRMLEGHGIAMEPKAFAVGLRCEHPQKMINISQYGRAEAGTASAAAYKLTATASGGRGVFSFCMCPGGYVVNASSEEGMLAVNGMSYSGRSGDNANAAIVVTVTPDDYPGEGPLKGVLFQQELERRAFLLGEGMIPMQRYGAFRDEVLRQAKGPEAEDGSVLQQRTAGAVDPSGQTREGAADRETGREILPQHKGASVWCDITGVLPPAVNLALVEGMEQFGRKIPGFDRGDAILSAVESRTSSPVRVTRDDTLQASIPGLYPIGEGPGYAGGITSAAMDGLRAAEQLISVYAPFDADGR
jgi:uncharacterized FAD-dependent dehydrogenase